MKKLILLFLTSFCSAGDKNGGVKCAACAIVTSWVDQYSSFHEKTAEEGIRKVIKINSNVRSKYFQEKANINSYFREMCQ